MSVLKVCSEISLMVAALAVLATGITFTMGRVVLANQLGLVAAGFIITGIVLLLIKNSKST